MEKLILVIVINIILAVIISEGVKYFDRQNRIDEARERANAQYRKRNGKFSRTKVVEKRVFAPIKKIKVNYYGEVYFI